eukprot:symbB.v1.2.009447.t1/scaffold601.1/size182750/11
MSKLISTWQLHGCVALHPKLSWMCENVPPSTRLSILLVTSFSFLNFLALPDPRAHSLLSAVLLKRRAAISGDPHSDPTIHGMTDEERVALLKAAEEALQAPLPVVQVKLDGKEHTALRGGHTPPPAAPPEPESFDSAAKTLDALRARGKAVLNAIAPAASNGAGGMASFSGESWLELPEGVDADELTFGTSTEVSSAIFNVFFVRVFVY